MKKQLFRGFSLLESLLVLLIAVLASIGLYQVFSPSSTQAAIKQEQKHMESLVDGVFNAYTTSNNFSSISTQTVAGLLNVPLSQDGQSLKTALNTVSATVRPSTTISANDSFDVVYSGPTSKECIGLVKAISPLSNGVFIGSNATIQETDGKISNETDISTFCNQSSMSTVTFRFVGQKNNFTSTSMNSCVCAPTSETQNIACPTGSSGTITQRRTGLCTGGTPACPSLAWSSWSTILNTCAVDGSTVTPTGPAVVVPPQTCIPSVETQTLACPVGQVGGILQQRSRSCPSNTWSSWVQVSSSCQVDTTRNTCTPRTVQSSRACPSGQGGQETVEQTSVCDTNGNETWGPVKLIGSTCTASCVSTGTCCVVGSRTRTENRLCGNGSYGNLFVQQKQSSTCATATATPVWPSTWIDVQTTGTCTTCPAPVTESQTQDVPAVAVCPTGQTGSHTWTSRQVRTRTMSYNCPNGTTALPSPTYSSWSSWTETSRLNETNTCAVVAPPSCKKGKWRKDAGSEGYSDAGSTYKYQWSWFNAETGVSGSGGSMPPDLFTDPCPVGSTAIFEWDDGYAGGGTFGYEYHVCEDNPAVTCAPPTLPSCVPAGDFTVIKTYWYCTNSLNNSGLYIPGDIPAMGTSYPSSGWVCQRFNGTGQNLNPGGRPFGAVIGYTWEYGATSGTVIIEFTPNPSSSMYHQVMLSNPGGRTDNGGSGVFIRGTVPPGKWVQGLQYPSATTILASGWNTSWGDRACP